LPECSVREALEQAVFGKKGKELVTASRGVIDHAKACQLCRDRGAYLERHGLVLPERPTSLVARLLRIALTLPDRFPHPIRPPKDETGKGRRSAFFIASIVSASACPVLLLNALSRLIQAGWQSDWWKAVASLGLILPVYFVGFYLAGWIWDVLHPADDQFSGYVLRWSFTGLGIFGSLGLVIPFLNHRHVSLAATLAVVAVLAAGGTLIGAVLWMKDRLWGALAKR
jgi:hypothetical protein